MMLAATTATAVPQQTAKEPQCPAGVILVSRAIDPDPDKQPIHPLPRAQVAPRGPAVLMPSCKTDERKKKDFPMA